MGEGQKQNHRERLWAEPRTVTGAQADTAHREAARAAHIPRLLQSQAIGCLAHSFVVPGIQESCGHKDLAAAVHLCPRSMLLHSYLKCLSTLP